MNKGLYKNAPLATNVGDRTVHQFVQTINRFLSRGQTDFTLMNKSFSLQHAYGEKWQLFGPEGHVCWFEKDTQGTYVPA